MIETLNRLDTQLFLFINERHNAFFDVVMFWASHKLFWIPFYLLIAYFIIKQYKKQSAYIFISVAVLITLCDQTASHLIKNAVKRLRPSHEPSLEGLVHLSEAGPGGNYGFVSSHSANAFGLAVFLILLLPKKYNPLKYALLFWAVLVAYSRVYNGVHYPGDVIVGGLIGAIYSFIVYILYTALYKKYFSGHKWANTETAAR